MVMMQTKKLRIDPVVCDDGRVRYVIVDRQTGEHVARGEWAEVAPMYRQLTAVEVAK